MRIRPASIRARASMTNASTTYIMPMRLWSTLVSHSDHSTVHLPAQVIRNTVTAAPSRTRHAAKVAIER